MALLVVILFGLNMVQTSKDIKRCEKSEYKEAGCSVYVKLNVPKK